MKKKEVIEATIENLYPLLASIDKALEPYECSEEILTELHICIEEVFVNIVSYAYGEVAGMAEIELEIQNGWLSILFMDTGIPYNPLEAEEPDVDLSAEERSVGGLGIFMVKTMMDAVCYEYKEGKNCLCIQKKLA